MASNRMMQAIDRLEQAVGRLEQEMQTFTVTGADSSASSGMDPAAARAALRSLDELIADLKGNARG